MTLQGKVQGGVVVLENGGTLPEGTMVSVTPCEKPGRCEEYLDSQARMARILTEMRESSITLPPGSATTTEMIREDRDR